MTSKLEKLGSILRGKSTMLIVLQDNPDPDAIASATALRELAHSFGEIDCSMASGGVVGRVENKALIKYLDLNLRTFDSLGSEKFDVVAMVDTQPGTGNNSLPPNVIPDIVIDHHPVKKATRSSPFTDVRSRYGATSSMMYEYLIEAKVEMNPPLATALLYGIRSDTQDLGRETTKHDIDAVIGLYPLANKRMLSDIEYASLPETYFELLSTALKNAEACGRAIMSSLGDIDNPDMICEVADFLLRCEGCTWALCHGITQGKLHLSLRTSDLNTNAGRIIRRIVGRKGTGGGHNALAGGQIPLTSGSRSEKRRVGNTVRRRFFRLLGEDEKKCKKLILPGPSVTAGEEI